MADSHEEGVLERWFLANVRRSVIFTIIVFGESIGLRLLRRVNPRMRLFRKLFVMYPANEHYAKKIVFPFWLGKYRTRLAPCMVYRHDGAWGLVLGTTLCERDLRRDADLVSRVKSLADEASAELGIEDVTYSGILPTLMVRAGLVREHTEADTTARVVAAGVEQVRKSHQMCESTRVVVLGGAGQIGSRVVSELQRQGRRVDVVDPNGGSAQLPEELHGQPMLLINVAHRGALRSHLPGLWPGVVYVNEVYPEPRVTEVSSLAERNIPVWHVAGVRALAIPPFPGAYGGGIPCCAASVDRDARPVIRRLA